MMRSIQECLNDAPAHKAGGRNLQNEQVYPIYHFRARWSEDGEHNTEYPWHYKGLPDGRVWNSVKQYRMFREVLSSSDLEHKVREWWAEFRNAERRGGRLSIAARNPDECVLTVVFVRNETWCLTWFQHWTFDNGQTDEEALLSFDCFVDRMEQLDEPEYCLMGAEDRWRWCGTKTGDATEQTAPPCRCKYCKEQGVIRIGH